MYKSLAQIYYVGVSRFQTSPEMPSKLKPNCMWSLHGLGHVEPPWVGGNNSSFGNLGLITKMATMYHPSNSFSQLSNNATTPESDISFSYPIAT